MTGKTTSSRNTDFGEQHSIAKTVFLHLLPGALIFLVYFVLVKVLSPFGLPSLLVFIMTLPLVLIPTELGLLYYLGWKRNGSLSLNGIVLYREPIRIRHYFWLIPSMFVLTVALLIAVSSYSGPIYELFGWWDESLKLGLDLESHSKNILLLTVILLIIGGGIIGPVVEELYFRGFLLPRLSRFGKWAPVLESTLFALYHFWSPWQTVERAVAWLPISFFGQYKHNIYVGMIVHCSINTILSIPLLLEILKL